MLDIIHSRKDKIAKDRKENAVTCWLENLSKNIGGIFSSFVIPKVGGGKLFYKCVEIFVAIHQLGIPL